MIDNELLSSPELKWPPDGVSGKYSVTRDTWLSSVGEEKNGSNGGAKRLKIKGQQEYALLDIEASSLKGKIVTGALMHIRSASASASPLARLSVSSISSPWTEGNSRGYRPQDGTSCFNQAQYRARNWAYPGSTLMDVALGRGHTIWKFADCSAPDIRGWQTCAVDADVVAARASGISYGFVLYDDLGSTWAISNKKFNYAHASNRYVYSRESRKSAPWLEIWTGGTDTIPPAPVSNIAVETRDLPGGEALIAWTTPEDYGGGKTLGFNVTYKRLHKEHEMPRYLIPMAAMAGEEVRMYMRDLSFAPGEKIDLTIRPVDSAGNVGVPFTKTVRVSSGKGPLNISGTDTKVFSPQNKLPKLGDIKISVMDVLDKVNPQTGEMIPARDIGYKGGNHIFSANKKQVRLQSARNEMVFFQLNLEGMTDNIAITYVFDEHMKLKPKIHQFAYVNVFNARGEIEASLPDPLIPLSGTFPIPSTAGIVRVSDQKNHSLILELYIPHDEPAGVKKGRVILSSGREKLELEVELTVWNFTLPNKLSFVPEMNAYEGASPYKGYEYYRLAHEHRTCINRLNYGWHGIPEYAPEWKDGNFDWTEWDRKVAPLLNGTAFEDMPRKSEPVDVFYLPFNENWPVSVFDNYRPSYWADEAFTARYKEDLSKGFAAFARHFDEKKWHKTMFQFYLNNKVYYRERLFKSSAPWILDEPVNTQDFWAIRWYGLLWHGAVDPVMGDARMWYRADVSFGEFGRDILSGVLDIEYVGGNTAQKVRMKEDEKVLWGKSYYAEYGTVNKIEASNYQPALWCISAWSKGASGVLPWQTIGDDNAWNTAQQTSLFYPHDRGPVPSVRLKAFTVGQQFVEYLTLLSDVTGSPRYAVVKWLKEQIPLDAVIDKAYKGDAGTAIFDDLSPEKLWATRYRIGTVLSDNGPVYKRSLVNKEKSGQGRTGLTDIGHVIVAPDVESVKPEVDSFSP